jgi:benzoyl-CoA reductase/2-hydroxyglutaryl-CoA dehydratase subunit BcrC/BadD/HgdB
MNAVEILNNFHEIAANPAKQMEKYLAQGKKVVLCAPIYTPEELIHSMGCVPMGVWGADIELQQAKEYFPAFICSIMQSILELGMAGAYKGASAIVIPSLCDSLKCLGENWKYAVTAKQGGAIPFIPMTYPQNRRCSSAHDFIMAGYKRVIEDIYKITGALFAEGQLLQSIRAYNEHNSLMRDFDLLASRCPSLSAQNRSDVYKSAWFMLKEEHSALVKELIQELTANHANKNTKVPIMTSGILCDSPALLQIFDDLGYQIVSDDVAAESRQYRTDCLGTSLDALAQKFADMDNCSVLFDPQKKRPGLIIKTAKERGAKGLVIALTKFCDPEEFDYPVIKKACEQAALPVVEFEVDRQMNNYAQARTALETFKEIVS